MVCYHTCQNFRKSLMFISSKICSLTSSLGYGSIYRDMKSVLLIAVAVRVTSACPPFHISILTEMSFRMLCLKRNSWELWQQKQGWNGRVEVLANTRNPASRIPSRSRNKNWNKTLQIRRTQNNCETQRLPQLSYFIRHLFRVLKLWWQTSEITALLSLMCTVQNGHAFDSHGE